MSNLTAEWIGNTTLKLKWEPVPVTDGVSATYIVYYSAIVESGNGTIETDAQMSKVTELYFVVIENLDPAAYYQLTVMVNLNQIQISSSVGIGM